VESIRNHDGVRPNVPNIVVGFIDNPNVGAASSLETDAAYLGIYRGTVLIVNELFNQFMARPDTLQMIGSPQMEYGGGTTPDYPTLMRHTYNRPPTAPRDDVRKYTSTHLFLTAFDFIVRHECAHIMHGHLALLRERAGISSIDESSGSSAPNFQQTLEIDADCYALYHELNPKLMRLVDRPEQEPLIAQFMLVSLVAVYSVHRVLGYGNYQPSTSHPSVGIRLTAMMSAAFAHFEMRLGVETASRVDRLITDAALLSEVTFATMAGVPLPHEELMSLFTSGEAAKIGMDIEKNWNVLHPDLVRLAYTTHLAAPQS
jgi:hypothetical protein